MRCKKNEKTVTWSQEKGHDLHSVSRMRRAFGYQGKILGYQQKRNNRKSGSVANFLGDGQENIGGMLRHLINEYRNQVADKEKELQKMELDILHLHNKLRDLESLLLDSQQKTCENQDQID